MVLRECHNEYSYYYPTLELAMKRIIREKGLSDVASEIIGAFCNGVSGDHILDSVDDYRHILDGFRHFASGVMWTLNHHPVEGC